MRQPQRPLGPRRDLISSLAGASRCRLGCGRAPSRAEPHTFRRELISTITSCSSPSARKDQCSLKGCPTHQNCAPAPLGSRDTVPLGGQHGLTGRRHRPHNNRRLAPRIAPGRTSPKQASSAAPTSRRDPASSRCRRWSPKSFGKERDSHDAPSGSLACCGSVTALHVASLPLAAGNAETHAKTLGKRGIRQGITD